MGVIYKHQQSAKNWLRAAIDCFLHHDTAHNRLLPDRLLKGWDLQLQNLRKLTKRPLQLLQPTIWEVEKLGGRSFCEHSSSAFSARYLHSIEVEILECVQYVISAQIQKRIRVAEAYMLSRR